MKIFKNRKRKYIIATSLVSAFVVAGLVITYYNSLPKEEPLIGAYIDGTYSETLPTKNSSYKVEKIVCDNNNNASWDYDKWGIKFSNWSTRSRCNIYFKSLENFTLANKTFYLDEVQKCPAMNNDGTVTVTEVEATNGYLCKAKDAYGDTYYYRGNVTNNYVKFGKWANDAPDIVYGYSSETSVYFKKYDSMEACQNDSYYNKNCTIINNRAGKDMYWRIIRINGDGTVRVIYDGTSAHANGESSEDRIIGTSAFNSSEDDNAYVGYMYGNSDAVVEPSKYYSSKNFTNTDTFYISKEYRFDKNTKLFTLKNPIQVLGSNLTTDYIGYYYTSYDPTSLPSSVDRLYKIMDVTAGSSSANIKFGYVRYGTSSKEVAQTNINDSTIKTYLDNWYKTNIVGTTNEQYLADNVFCNDRSMARYNSGTGAGVSETYYGGYKGPWSGASYNFICPQKNDAFTVSDTTNGNGALTYPVGLLSYDESILAGGWNVDNRVYYLYSGQSLWTSSPVLFSGDSSLVGEVSFDGCADIGSQVRSDNGVRPVLNLKADVLVQGSGTASDPYRIFSD